MTTTLELLDRVRAAGGSFLVDGDRVSVRAPAPLPAAMLVALRARKPEVIRLLSSATSVPAPLILGDGRRMWRLGPAAAAAPTPAAEALVARLRAQGVVLVADGEMLHVVGPRGWEDERELAAAAASAAAIVGLLRGEHRQRCADGRAQVFEGTP